MTRGYFLERVAYALLGAYASLAVVLRAMGEREGALIAACVVVGLFVVLFAVGFRRLRAGRDAETYITRRLPLVMRPARRLRGKR